MADNYFSKLIDIFIRPREFFSQYKNEKGMTKPFIFLVFTIVIVAIISMIFDWLAYKKISSPLIVLGDVILTALLYGFLFSAIFHIGVKIAKGKAPYYQTFKAFAYTSAFGIPFKLIEGLLVLSEKANVIIGTVLVILGVALILGLLLVLGYGLNKFTGLAGWVLGLIYLVSLVLFTIIGFWIEYNILNQFPIEYL